MMELAEKKSEMVGQIFSVVVLNDEVLDETVQLFGQEQGTAPPNKMEIFFSCLADGAQCSQPWGNPLKHKTMG